MQRFLDARSSTRRQRLGVVLQHLAPILRDKKATVLPVLLEAAVKALDLLLDRDRELVRWAGEGATTAEIAERLDKPEEAEAAVNDVRDFLIENKDMVRKYYDSSAEVQQMFVNEDIYLAQSWSGAAAKLIMDMASLFSFNIGSALRKLFRTLGNN